MVLFPTHSQSSAGSVKGQRLFYLTAPDRTMSNRAPSVTARTEVVRQGPLQVGSANRAADGEAGWHSTWLDECAERRAGATTRLICEAPVERNDGLEFEMPSWWKKFAEEPQSSESPETQRLKNKHSLKRLPDLVVQGLYNEFSDPLSNFLLAKTTSNKP